MNSAISIFGFAFFGVCLAKNNPTQIDYKMNFSKGTEEINKEGAVENKVDTVDYSKPAGQENPQEEDVHVVHLTRKGKESGESKGVLAGAAGAVANTLRRAKDATSGGAKDKTTD